MLVLQTVLLLLALPSHAEETTTAGPGALLPLPKGACTGWLAGIPGHPGHNGIPGRDGRDGTPGEKGEKGDAVVSRTFLWVGDEFVGSCWSLRNVERGDDISPCSVKQAVVGGPRDSSFRNQPKQMSYSLWSLKSSYSLGLVGPKGDTGDTGVTGVEGPRGFPGIPGRKGERGESAYVYRSAFSVGLQAHVAVPNVPIRFTKIFYNQQNHYDGTTGKFHCNIPGLYYFSYHITVYLKDMKVSLFRKDKAELFTYDQYQEKNVDQASGSVLLPLAVGDQVWLQVYGDGNHTGLYADNVNDSTFTGFLLYHDIDLS
ncbi:Adiponectin [Heterocephalus glaber]|uniref:Adiponectin n=1 Tax=Heterocephalus glaber TaxID=10181 RepID=G5BT83_HETGA|nr:Adiponectin [Heterocephalus glaber]